MGVKMKYINIVMTVLFLLGIFTNAYALNYDDHLGIYYDEVQATNNVIINDVDGLKLNYSANLSQPGDFYELRFDVVNDSSVDMYIDDYHYGETNEYIKYDFTYQNGDSIHKGDIIKKGERKRLKYRVSYNSLILDDFLYFDSSFGLRFEQVL